MKLTAAMLQFLSVMALKNKDQGKFFHQWPSFQQHTWSSWRTRLWHMVFFGLSGDRKKHIWKIGDKEIYGRGMYMYVFEWKQSVCYFESHTKIHQRAPTLELEYIVWFTLWMSASLCPNPPQCSHKGPMNAIDTLAAMEAKHGPNRKAASQQSLSSYCLSWKSNLSTVNNQNWY